MDFDQLHPEIQKAAKRLLVEALESVYRCGDTGVFMGYWVESHTLGCRKEAGDPDLWEAHWAIWDEYSKDDQSVLIGDPADGVFVSITPVVERPATMGAEMLIELGGRRVKKTVPLETADQIAEIISNQLRPLSDAALVAGSVRRRKPEVGDIEFVVLPKDLPKFLKFVSSQNFTGGDRIQKGILHMYREWDLPVELYIAHDPKELGGMLFMYTGDYVFNIAMRSIAKRQGWKMDQYGIWDAKTGKPLLQSPDERDFFDFLGVDWHDPEDRSFKDRPRKRKKAGLGAEMLIELGNASRRTGYIHLDLFSPREDGSGMWVLRVERIDPYGGDSWKRDFPFEKEDEATRWFNGIIGDEDLDVLIAQSSG